MTRLSASSPTSGVVDPAGSIDARPTRRPALGRWPAFVLLVGVLAATALVGVGSGHSAADRPEPRSPMDLRSLRTLLVATTILLAIGAVALVVLVLIDAARRRTEAPPRRGGAALSLPRGYLPTALLVAGLLSVIFGFLLGLGWRPLPPTGDEVTGPPATAPPVVEDAQFDPGADANDRRIEWPAVTGIVIVALGAGLAVAGAVAARTHRLPRAGGVALDAAITESLLDLDGLSDDPDHCKVVIRAYARMELALAAHGTPRLAHEAPFEYLERALTGLGAGGPAAHRLTELFERARFSHHPVDAAMRADAAATLEAIRADLNGVAA